jgi:hypothetical protein
VGALTGPTPEQRGGMNYLNRLGIPVTLSEMNTIAPLVCQAITEDRYTAAVVLAERPDLEPWQVVSVWSASVGGWCPEHSLLGRR